MGVVLATQDYPRTNTPLTGLNPDVSLGNGCRAFWGASKLADGTVSTAQASVGSYGYDSGRSHQEIVIVGLRHKF